MLLISFEAMIQASRSAEFGSVRSEFEGLRKKLRMLKGGKRNLEDGGGEPKAGTASLTGAGDGFGAEGVGGRSAVYGPAGSAVTLSSAINTDFAGATAIGFSVESPFGMLLSSTTVELRDDFAPVDGSSGSEGRVTVFFLQETAAAASDPGGGAGGSPLGDGGTLRLPFTEAADLTDAEDEFDGVEAAAEGAFFLAPSASFFVNFFAMET